MGKAIVGKAKWVKQSGQSKVGKAVDEAMTRQQEAVCKIASELIGLAQKHALTIGTAESCTGGMIAAALTSVPGSSEVFKGGVVSYANEIKIALLGVDKDTLDRNGAVCEEVALQMVRGARRVLHVDVAVSATGIAGPGGGSAEKPVGTVWIAVADDHGQAASLYHFSGGREQIREATVRAALQDLKAFVQRQSG